MKVVVTGASSPIGRAVKARLDSIDTMEPRYLASPRSQWSDGMAPVDVSDPVAFRRAIVETGAHAVIHLAAITGTACDADPDLSEQVNVGSIRTLVAAAAESELTRVIFASSAAVYGDRLIAPVSEQTPTRPTSTYGRMKESAERVLEEAEQLDTVTARIFNVWGPELESSLIMRLLTSRVDDLVPLRGPDDFVRDYVYVDEVAEALVASLTIPLAERHITLNIGSGVALSNAELLLRLERQRELHYRIVQGQPSYAVADMTLTRKIMGFSPTVLP